ncbi:hypothetical protein BO86DRAFT_163047 [Aspergillus japonicus CBS 114.51]|uniref:Uncharacterized protein n=1 Tax=Aspergillus japonicus CBS 114.51 TaxID=1448312 RepID=A0A8T8XC43_ASPJA|nr:hypothetical protein BO86DRAFT_163047 [Aspergillus japonicus CBS 114.51]RAH85665.1 hypothetical protein BO86DRAFT_163047 [Aspergillus japonicus CBS 114.51]
MVDGLTPTKNARFHHRHLPVCAHQPSQNAFLPKFRMKRREREDRYDRHQGGWARLPHQYIGKTCKSESLGTDLRCLTLVGLSSCICSLTSSTRVKRGNGRFAFPTRRVMHAEIIGPQLT